jgi:hypothetical protein
VNLSGVNIGTTNKGTETLIDAREEAGLEIRIEKTKYMLLPCHQNSGKKWAIKTANRSFENLSLFKYFRTVPNQNLILEEIKGY